MRAAYLPGFEPPVTRDYYSQVARRATMAGGLTGEKHRVFAHLCWLSRGGEEPIGRSNESIAGDLELHPSTIRRILAELKTEHPPGVDHPYIGMHGRSQRRQILVLYRPRKGADPEPQGARASARPSMQGARASARPHHRKSNESTPVAATPLFEGIQEKSNVNVVFSSGTDLACAYASETAGPVAIIAPVPARDAPVPSAPAVAPADGINRGLAGLSADQLRERIAAMKAERAVLRTQGRIPAATRLLAPICEAELLLEAIEGTPAPTPTVSPPTKPPAPTVPIRPDFRSLLGRLFRAAGPAPVEDYARFVAESLQDGHSLANHRRIARDIQSGVIPARRAWEGYQMARNGARAGTARSPGAVYTAYVRLKE